MIIEQNGKCLHKHATTPVPAVGEYVRIKFKGMNQSAKWYWAIKKRPQIYRVVGQDGETGETDKYLIGKPMIERKACICFHYGTMEVLKGKLK